MTFGMSGGPAIAKYAATSYLLGSLKNARSATCGLATDAGSIGCKNICVQGGWSRRNRNRWIPKLELEIVR
jgi:hypothetical protein